MAGPYKTPGVYVEEISKFPPSIAQVETAIPAFIGFTEEHRKDGADIAFKPTRISSMLEYDKFFGGPQQEEQLVVVINQKVDAKRVTVDESVTAKFDPAINRVASRHIMFYALQSYFANGGGPCYIVSIGSYQPIFGAPIPLGEDGNPGTFFYRALKELRKEDEPTLYVAPEIQGMDVGDQGTLIQEMLKECASLQDRFVITDFHVDGTGLNTAGDVLEAATTFRENIPNTEDFAKYGAAYFPNIRSVFNYAYKEDTVLIQHNRIMIAENGRIEPGSFNDMTLVAIPDKSMTAKAKVSIDNFSINLPPSAAMAGIYARVDNLRGVWKAPANESVFAVNGLTYKVTNEVQDFMNVDTTAGKSINCIRAFTGKGILVWGGRTFAGNSNEWRYISVRRFFNMVEESTKKATERFVFEPNDANTWVKVRAMIENFLILQWNAGALQGSTPEKAFYVRVGLGETMTALDILEGRMNVEIGMAVVRPAEFIILKFSHKMVEA